MWGTWSVDWSRRGFVGGGHEATTADPIHLMRVFGISTTTAMKYVYAAHPERRSNLPR
jgi:hypothetical protein